MQHQQRVLVTADELQAQMACSILESHGIPALHRATVLGQVQWGGVNVGMAGHREVIVRVQDVADAQALLEADFDRAELPADGEPAREHTWMRSAFMVFTLLVFGLPLLLWLAAILFDIIQRLG